MKSSHCKFCFAYCFYLSNDFKIKNYLLKAQTRQFFFRKNALLDTFDFLEISISRRYIVNRKK